MLFRNINGELIEINKYDFKNDKLYYQKIMEIKKQFTKLNNKNEQNHFEYTNYSTMLLRKIEHNN
jgi:hypothetical protein